MARMQKLFGALVVGVVVLGATVGLGWRSAGAGSSLPVVSMPKAAVAEVEGDTGTTAVTLTASLSAASSSNVTVDYSTLDGAATLGDNDYIAASGTLSFSPGATSQTISVLVVGDTKLEDYETFGLRLSTPVNATLGNATGHVEILNDDKPQLAMANAQSVFAGQAAVFKPHLVQRYYQPIGLNARTLDGTAIAGADYAAINTDVTFPAGSKSPVPTSVPTLTESMPDGPERFSVAVTGSGVLNDVTRTATITGTCAGTVPPVTYQHVVVVVMENKTYTDVIGAAAAPFQTALARACGSANHYAAVASPSRPNYIAMTAGNTYGCEGSDANPPGGCVPPSPSLFEQVLNNGGTVRSYAESMSTNCETTSHDLYAVKHNPWPYFASEATHCQQYNQPMPATLDVNNLPTLMYLVPNLCNDTHNCSVATGDQWLHAHIEPILDSAAYRSRTTAVIITYDEYTYLPNMFAAQSVHPGTTATTATSHYGLLRTLEDMLALTPLGQAATTATLRNAMHI